MPEKTKEGPAYEAGYRFGYRVAPFLVVGALAAIVAAIWTGVATIL